MSEPITHQVETDILVIGGGTGGPMAAIKAKEKNPDLRVVLMEKANVKRSGAISMGMDGLNNAVIPGHATPEQYVKDITIANDGIVAGQIRDQYGQIADWARDRYDHAQDVVRHNRWRPSGRRCRRR